MHKLNLSWRIRRSKFSGILRTNHFFSREKKKREKERKNLKCIKERKRNIKKEDIIMKEKQKERKKE